MTTKRQTIGSRGFLFALLTAPLACSAPVEDRSGPDSGDAFDTDDAELADEDGFEPEGFELADEGDTGPLDDPDFDPDSSMDGFDSEEEESDPQALTQLGGGFEWSYGSQESRDLGPDSDRTCFLTGVVGELQSASGTTDRAYVRTVRRSGRWKLEVNSGAAESNGDGGSGVGGWATCIPVTANRQEIGWAGNSSYANPSSNDVWSWVEDTGRTHCFLTNVNGTVGFLSNSSWTGITRKKWGSNDIWHLTGYLVEQTDGRSGGGAGMVCVDMPFHTDSTFSHSAPGAGSTTTVSAPDRTCGIERIGGHFGSVGFDWGVWVAGSSLDWKAFAGKNRSIHGRCIKKIRISGPFPF